MLFLDHGFCRLLTYLFPKAVNVDGSWIGGRRGLFPSPLPLGKAEPHFACHREKAAWAPRWRCHGRVPWLVVRSSAGAWWFHETIGIPSSAQPCPGQPCDLGQTLVLFSVGRRVCDLRSVWFCDLLPHFSEALSSPKWIIKIVYKHAWGAVILEKWSKAKGKKKETKGRVGDKGHTCEGP